MYIILHINSNKYIQINVRIIEAVFRSFQLSMCNRIAIFVYYSGVSCTTRHRLSLHKRRRSLLKPLLLSVRRSFHSTTTFFRHRDRMCSGSRGLRRRRRRERAPERWNWTEIAPERRELEESEVEERERVREMERKEVREERCGEIVVRERGERRCGEMRETEREDLRRREMSGGREERGGDGGRDCGERREAPLLKTDLEIE
ncbi:hypothetical protein AgCh_039345 [Apium graveolens]